MATYAQRLVERDKLMRSGYALDVLVSAIADVNVVIEHAAEVQKNLKGQTAINHANDGPVTYAGGAAATAYGV